MVRGGTTARARFLGVAIALLFSLPVGAEAASTRILHSFNNIDGSVLDAGLTPDADGSFVGVTSQGASDGSLGNGFLFRIQQSGRFKILHEFAGADGSSPQGEVAINGKGAIFGATRFSGTADGGCGCGLVYKRGPKGDFSVVYRFKGGADGGYPHSALLLDGSGALYGSAEGLSGITAAVVFKIAPDGTETVLHTFTAATGDHPDSSGVVMDAAGALYGTTSRGGDFGDGVVYKISPKGKYTVLHHFAGGPGDGDGPSDGVTLAQDGSLYGTTKFGGSSGGGVVFKINAKGRYSVVHAFESSNGRFPIARPFLGSDGALYGTTSQGGGSCDCGVAFKLTQKGRYSVLHRFTANPDGREPAAGLAADAKGRLYGTTHFGGTSDRGTVFRVIP